MNKELPLCKCGCGQPVAHPWNKFIHGHAGKGKSPSEKTKHKISETLKHKMYGEKNGNWQGGTSFLPYCYKFNNEFKERVRDFFKRKCFECSITEEEQMNKLKKENKRSVKLSVHHVNYDKMVCCNDIIPLFVPLCSSCHRKSHVKHSYWEEKFTKELMERTGGRCFIPTYLMELIDDEKNWIQCLDKDK